MFPTLVNEGDFDKLRLLKVHEEEERKAQRDESVELKDCTRMSELS